MILQRFRLEETGLAYIRKELQHSSSYGRFVLKNLPLQNGILESFIPSDLLLVVTEFEDSIFKPYSDHGGKADELYLELQSVYVNLISQFLIDNNGYAIFETLERPNDPVIHREKMQFFTFDDRVYLFLSRDKTDKESIQNYWKSARGYPRTIGLILPTKELLPLRSGEEVTKGKFDLLASQTTGLLIGAYDNEGFLLWNRK